MFFFFGFFQIAHNHVARKRRRRQKKYRSSGKTPETYLVVWKNEVLIVHWIIPGLLTKKIAVKDFIAKSDILLRYNRVLFSLFVPSRTEPNRADDSVNKAGHRLACPPCPLELSGHLGTAGTPEAAVLPGEPDGPAREAEQ